MPDRDSRSPFSDAPEEREPAQGIPVRVVAKAHPRRRTALSCEAVRWLLLRAGGMWARYGDIVAPLSPAFLDQVDETQPVAVIRAHLERTAFHDDGEEDVAVVLCSFAMRWPEGARMVHELVCRPADYVRVAHGETMLADWTPGEFRRLTKLSAVTRGSEPTPPANALPDGTSGEIRPDGSVVLDDRRSEASGGL